MKPKSAAAGDHAHTATAMKKPTTFTFFDDLTMMNFQKMKALAADERVASCWAANGHIKYKLVDSQVVKKVSCVLDKIDQILS
jgi:hypothetical protein